MIVVNAKLIREFGDSHADAKLRLDAWYTEALDANWGASQDIKNRYPSARFLKNNVVIFRIGGNNYRLETKVRHQQGIVVLVWVGTHSEYDRRNKLR